MAWTVPVTWKVGDLRNDPNAATRLNAQIKGNLEALDQHVHSGASGAGSGSIGPLVRLEFPNQGVPPAVTGRLLRNGADLYWYDGSVAYKITNHTH